MRSRLLASSAVRVCTASSTKESTATTSWCSSCLRPAAPAPAATRRPSSSTSPLFQRASGALDLPTTRSCGVVVVVAVVVVVVVTKPIIPAATTTNNKNNNNRLGLLILACLPVLESATNRHTNVYFILKRHLFVSCMKLQMRTLCALLTKQNGPFCFVSFFEIGPDCRYLCWATSFVPLVLLCCLLVFCGFACCPPPPCVPAWLGLF